MKKIKKSKSADISCSWIGRFNVVLMSILPKLIYIQHNPIHNPISYLVDIEKLILNLHAMVKDL